MNIFEISFDLRGIFLDNSVGIWYNTKKSLKVCMVVFRCVVGGMAMGSKEKLSVDAQKLSVLVACEYGWWHRGCPFQKFPCSCLVDR